MNDNRSPGRLVYITDLDRQRSGGGSYAVNWNAFDQLSKRFHASYAGPLTPRPSPIEAAVSKFRRRVLHRPGRFFYFSPATLDRNAFLAAPYIDRADAVVFRSAARWCRCKPRVPYFIYLDVAFHTFFHNAFEPRDFDSRDLDRIWREEAEFLDRAAAVFFESRWGLEQARSAYGLSGSHYVVAGRGGGVDPPERDVWNGASRKLLTIAVDFTQKGGDITLAAYGILRKRFPAITWHIVGAPPEGDWESVGGISYEGMLRPDIAAERERLRQLLADAFLLVHPTREDTSPLVLTEAAYFGCPAISVKSFAIPELVEDGRTGMLVDAPATPASIANAITILLDDDDRYLEMRRTTRANALDRHSWDRIGNMIGDNIAERTGW